MDVRAVISSIRPHSVLAASVMLAASVVLGYGVEQSDFSDIALAYTVFFGCYAWVMAIDGKDRLQYWLALAVVLRILMVFAFPALSDDIYRFVWDGRLWLAGHNPFDHLPAWYMEEGHRLTGLTEELFHLLNSPDYYTIYPPVAQFTFVASVWVSPNSIWGAAVVMKLFLLAAEIGSIYLLLQLLEAWQLPRGRVLWYALNPLVIVEVMGNLHFEGVMVFFVLLALFGIQKQRYAVSAMAMTLSVASKLLPLMFLPFLIRRLGWKRSCTYFLIMGGLSLLLWGALFSASFVANFANSLDLYFRRFEFNASVFNLLQWLGYQLEGNNLIKMIGPCLALVVFVTIVLRALLEKNKEWKALPQVWLFAITIYLFCATTVHPWYTILPVVLAVFTPKRWAMLWSGLIVFTYIHYMYPNSSENLYVVGAEYIIVIGYLIWEAIKSTRKRKMIEV